MDPDANWKEQCELRKRGDNPARLRELRAALKEWIARGGFPPKARKRRR